MVCLNYSMFKPNYSMFGLDSGVWTKLQYVFLSLEWVLECWVEFEVDSNMLSCV